MQSARPPPEIDEGETPVAPQILRGPTKQERDAHNLSHILFRDWCDHCVNGRSKESPYKHSEDSPYPVVQIHYFFVKSAEDANVITCISSIAVVTGYGAWPQVKCKNASDTHAIRLCASIWSTQACTTQP